MYQLRLFHPHAAAPTEIRQLARAAEVLDEIPRLLARYGDCSHIEVMQGVTRLFSVDCSGNRLP